ncbi:MAG: hypothetical protein ACUVX9_15655 [Anaerolineae bacterium]
MTAPLAPTAYRRGLSTWLVWLVVAVALAGGWALKAYAENLSETFARGGVSVRYPAGWVASESDEGVLRFRDPRAGGVAPILEVRSYPGAAGQGVTAALTVQADALALTRARVLSAYRTLETDYGATWRGRPALRVTYAFVRDLPNPALANPPVVVLGEDLMVLDGDRVIVFTLQAPEDQYPRLRGRLEALTASARLGLP